MRVQGKSSPCTCAHVDTLHIHTGPFAGAGTSQDEKIITMYEIQQKGGRHAKYNPRIGRASYPKR